MFFFIKYIKSQLFIDNLGTYFGPSFWKSGDGEAKVELLGRRRLGSGDGELDDGEERRDGSRMVGLLRTL